MNTDMTTNYLIESNRNLTRNNIYENEYAINQNFKDISAIFDDNIIPYDIPCKNIHTKGIPPTDYHKLHSVYNKEFYNFELLHNMFCRYSGQLLTWNKDLGKYGNIKNVGLLEFLTGKGKYGSVYTNFMNNINNYFIIKVIKDYDEHEFKTEAIISFLVNNLRKKIPNFVMTFGAFISKEPMNIDKTYSAIGLTNKSDTGYLILENIKPSISLFDLFFNDYRINNKSLEFKFFKNNASLKDFLLLLSQICLSLAVAKKEIGFTHYDLNQNNLLIRKGEPGSYIKYELENETYYIQSDVVATIIDFGFSHAVFKERNISLGKYRFEEYGIMPETSYPMHDIYRIYMSSMSNFKYSRQDLFEQLKPIFRFFNRTENIEDALKNQINIFYCLPYSVQNASTTHSDFMNFLINTYPTIDFYKKTQQKELNCDNFGCSNIDDFTIHYPDNFNILYNLKNEGKDISMFEDNYVEERNEWVQDINEDYADVKDLYSKKEYPKTLFLCYKILADIKILNSLSVVFEKKILYTSKTTNHIQNIINQIERFT